ncbi:MAG: Lyase-like protein [Nitrospinae bacterium CG11_big_fil_rev_8_21_14_0_20_56_8]|nr:MAG: Lyase-like protein [Nitrospinae bacterium CG11_big_fil_rev_8_21_14_0_20_56_8]
MIACLSIYPVHSESAAIDEFLTPTPDSSPTDLAFDAAGHLWFTEINGNRIGRLAPGEAEPGTSKGITEYELPQANSKPHYLLIARDGMIWFSEMSGNRIGVLDPGTGTIREFPIPTPNSEPHHLKEGADGSIWFLEFESNKLARLDPKSGQIAEFQVKEGHPHDLEIVDGGVWYTQGGKFWARMFYNKVARYDIATGKIVEIDVLPEQSVPHGLTQTGDGTLWFTQLFESKIARLDWKTQPWTMEMFPLPGRKGPHDLVVDEKRGWVWYTLNRADSIGRLDLARAKPGTSEGMEEFPIPTPKAHPNELVVDGEGNVWFTEMGHYFMGKFQNKIGRLKPDGPLAGEGTR